MKPLSDRQLYWLCVYCGKEKPSDSGTGVDVECCGEIGHVTPVQDTPTEE